MVRCKPSQCYFCLMFVFEVHRFIPQLVAKCSCIVANEIFFFGLLLRIILKNALLFFFSIHISFIMIDFVF
jgi:hypothetical protein